MIGLVFGMGFGMFGGCMWLFEIVGFGMWIVGYFVF